MNSTSQNTKMDIFFPHFGFKTKRVVAAHILTSHTTKPNVVFCYAFVADQQHIVVGTEASW